MVEVEAEAEVVEHPTVNMVRIVVLIMPVLMSRILIHLRAQTTEKKRWKTTR